LWLVADGRLQEFAGDLDDYQQWLRSRARQRSPRRVHTHASRAGAGNTAPARIGAGKTGAGGKKAASAKAPAETKAPRRDPLIRLRQQLDQVEVRIAALAAERSLLEAELVVAASPLENNKQQQLHLRRANLQRDAAYLEMQWMEIGTAIEAEESMRDSEG